MKSATTAFNITPLKTLKFIQVRNESHESITWIPFPTILNFQFIINGMPLGHTQDNTPSSKIITGHYSLSWLAQFRLLKLTVNLHSKKIIYVWGHSVSPVSHCLSGGDNLDFVNKPNVQSPCESWSYEPFQNITLSVRQKKTDREGGRKYTLVIE